MKKKSAKSSDDTQLTEGIDAFEEWEKSEGQGSSEPQANEGEDLAVGQDEPLEAGPPIQDTGEVASPDTPQRFSDELAGLSPDVPVNLVAVIGRTTITLDSLISYRVGEVIDLGRVPGETVDLVANGKLIARGELVEMDGKMGVRILKMVR